MPSWTNPNLTGGNKFDKAKTPDSEETAVVADVRDRPNWSALADQRKPNVLLGGTLGGGAPVTLALGDRGPGHPRNLAGERDGFNAARIVLEDQLGSALNDNENFNGFNPII